MAERNPNRRETYTATDAYILDDYFSDTAELPRKIRGFIVGNAGNVVMVTEANLTLAAFPVVAGQYLPFAPKQIKSTSTTASSLLGLI